jgi:RecB family endonuclease NucS
LRVIHTQRRTAFVIYNTGTLNVLRIDKSDKKLVRLPTSALSEANHWERQLQAMICADPNPFCEEIGESLWFLGQEIRPSEVIADRIDMLAVDEGGSSVIIELKRGTNKLQLLQALSYAGMISRWSPEKSLKHWRSITSGASTKLGQKSKTILVPTYRL